MQLITAIGAVISGHGQAAGHGHVRASGLESSLGVRLLNRTTRRISVTEEGRHYLERCRRILAEVDDAEQAMVAVPVGQIRRVVVASPGLLRATGKPRHPRDLESLPCVRFTPLMPGTTWHFVENGRPLSIQVGGQLTCNQAAASVDACVAGLGFGLFISYQVCRQTEAKQLREVLRTSSPRRCR